MRLLRIAAGVLNQTPLDWEGNRSRIVAALREARAGGVSLLCLPELCITGYGCEDAFHSLGVLREAERTLAALLPETKGMVVSFGLPVLVGHGVYNAAALAVDGRLVGLAAKRFLAGDGIHYEPRWFKPWPEAVRGELPLAGARVPIGDLVFEIGGVRLGFEICEDAWVASRPGASLARAGIDVILNPSASHFAFGKVEVRKRFVLEGSRAFGTTYVYANLLGNDAGRIIYDGGALIASEGRLVAYGRRFSFADHLLTSAVVDVEATRMSQARIASYQPHPTAAAARTIEAPFAWPAVAPERPRLAHESWEGGAAIKEEEFLRAVALGLFDYLRKSRARGFVVSLSGGCDSAAVVLLAASALRLAEREIGLHGVRRRLAHVPGLDAAADVRALTERLLTTAYQGTAQSSTVTREAARGIADAAGARHLELDVDPFVRGYVAAIEGAVGRPLGWERDDLALQNIQARVRGPSVWLLANLEGKLLLTTSNRTEAAVGYATMDGDTCGGLAPIAGIDKAYLRRWLVWLQQQGGEGLGPVLALAAVTSQRSTPELRPASAKQASEEDLMPFEVLDVIERFAIRDRLSPSEVFARLAAERPDVSAETRLTWVSRFFTMFAQNQWKRERYAPSFHLDDENLDPKSWNRFPILSGGYRFELEELQAAVARGLADGGADESGSPR